MENRNPCSLVHLGKFVPVFAHEYVVLVCNRKMPDVDKDRDACQNEEQTVAKPNDTIKLIPSFF